MNQRSGTELKQRKSPGVGLVSKVVRVIPPGRGVSRGVATLPVVLVVGRHPGQYHLLRSRRGPTFGCWQHIWKYFEIWLNILRERHMTSHNIFDIVNIKKCVLQKSCIWSKKVVFVWKHYCSGQTIHYCSLMRTLKMRYIAWFGVILSICCYLSSLILDGV